MTPYEKLSGPKVLNARDLKRMPANAVYVGRRHRQFLGVAKWGNPFRLRRGAEDPRTRRDAIELFRLHMTVGEGRHLDLTELRGRDLVCWCAPLPCHADVLLEMANR